MPMDAPASARQPGMPRPLPWACPQLRVDGDRIYIGNVLPVTPEGEFIEASDIRTQTDIAFQRLRDALAEAGRASPTSCASTRTTSTTVPRMGRPAIGKR